MISIHEIFPSISGEVAGCIPQGAPATFIRFAGCNIRCSYCDAPKAQVQKMGSSMSIEEITEAIRHHRLPNVIITGGEPLVQKEGVKELLHEMPSIVERVAIETNGTITIGLPKQNGRFEWWSPAYGVELSYVVDYKMPSSGAHVKRLAPMYYRGLTSADVIKFVIGSAEDLDHLNWIVRTEEPFEAELVVSPVISRHNKFISITDAAQAEYITQRVIELNQQTKHNLRMSVQIHKFLGVD